MNMIDFSNPLVSPFGVIIPAIVMVGLMVMTMVAVIRRERAMNLRRREDSERQVAYSRQWRQHSAA